MSYAMTLALQESLFARLKGDGALGVMVGDAIYDAVPSGTAPDLYVVIGAEKARDASDADGRGSVHEFTVSVLTDRSGFADAKATAGIVVEALDAPLQLSRGRVLAQRFHKAAAARIGTANQRRIDLIFNARLSDD